MQRNFRLEHLGESSEKGNSLKIVGFYVIRQARKLLCVWYEKFKQFFLAFD